MFLCIDKNPLLLLLLLGIFAYSLNAHDTRKSCDNISCETNKMCDSNNNSCGKKSQRCDTDKKIAILTTEVVGAKTKVAILRAS